MPRSFEVCGTIRCLVGILYIVFVAQAWSLEQTIRTVQLCPKPAQLQMLAFKDHFSNLPFSGSSRIGEQLKAATAGFASR